MHHVATALGLVTWTFVVALRAARAEAAFGRHHGNTFRRAAACIPVIVFASAFAEGTAVFPSALASIAVTIAAFGDARTGYIFDAITFPAACLTAGVALATGKAAGAAGGVALLVGTFGLVYLLSRGRAIGLGDVKAMYAIGAGFGPFAALVAISAASISGIIAAMLCSARSGERSLEIRFGPHLAVGASFALVSAPSIAHRMIGP